MEKCGGALAPLQFCVDLRAVVPVKVDYGGEEHRHGRVFVEPSVDAVE
jgi:hypothetical protein